MTALIVVLVVVLIALFITVAKNKDNVELQHATVEVPVITVESEAEFEEQLQKLLDELSPIALYYLAEREEYFANQECDLEDAYQIQHTELRQGIHELKNRMPMSVKYDSRCQKVNKALRDADATSEPLRFFKVVQHQSDGNYFETLYNLLVEYGYEESRRILIETVSCSYCNICSIIQQQNQLETDLESFEKFIANNAALIDSLK